MDGTRKVFKLKKTFFGLHQSPQAFWKYITEKLEACGLEQSKFDPCLFVGTKVILVIYVDNIIFGVKTQRISIAQQCNCVSLVLTLNRKAMPGVSSSHVGMEPRNRFA
jgi:hypothetical protein